MKERRLVNIHFTTIEENDPKIKVPWIYRELLLKVQDRHQIYLLLLLANIIMIDSLYLVFGSPILKNGQCRLKTFLQIY